MKNDTPALILGADGRFRWHLGDRVLPFICGGDGDTPEPLTVPEDLGPDHVDDDALAALEAGVDAELVAIRDRAAADPASITADDADRASQLRAAQDEIKAELASRAEARQATIDAVFDATSSVAPAAGPDDTPDGDEAPAEGEPPADPADPASPSPAPEPAPAPVEGVEVVEAGDVPVPVAAASRRRPIQVPAVPARPTLNPPLSLSEIAANAPAPQAPNRRPARELVLTAANGMPGFENGQRLGDLAALADAMAARAGNMAATAGGGVPMPVATMRREFEHVLEEGASLEDVDRVFQELVSSQFPTVQTMQALVAAGGWCAPSEIDYSFFNVAGPPAGLVDLPTIGIRRGGLRWPISLTLADFFGLSGAPASGIPSNATMPWEWTETDDISAVTGSPTKSCLRPPCPSFDEERLRVWGLCVLAGNLTEAAYPEVIRHFVMLTQIAHARVQNRRHILMMLADPTVSAVTPTVGTAASATTHTIGAAELIATHMRAKYGAPQGSVMEYMLPFWARGIMRSDLAKRNGWDNLAAADAYLMSLFDARDIRVQWVEDWQTNTGWNGGATIGADTTPVAWPTSFDGLMFFPGHYFLGRGFNLNLGVVRDSVLNETNDHTAAWTEEGTLVGARGPEAIRITNSPVYPNGYTGAQATQTAASA